MLTQETLTTQTLEMYLVDSEDKLEQSLLSKEEIAALERLVLPGTLDTETSQRWVSRCGGYCGGYCGGHCRHRCGGRCRRCWPRCYRCGGKCGFGSFGSVSDVMEDGLELEFGN
ncbi:hypothetical protein [Nostoc sp. UHCC 0870]|uniref:hypothetical protein n=1 Tax=Nostoc sp. UHCC 0870 TaxID=2914041 RepID=UPI001EE0407E|nr:hypothetical protein [Nostoc sp. UHCC 0870]UKO96637.1 hypothetical protein L6494_18715 [Nostoc sp. UHCC 0870]